MKENEIQVLGYSPKRESLRRYWPWLAAAAVILLIIGILIGKFAIRESRIPEHQYGESTIDSCLQVTVDSLLKDKMTEINAMSGQAIVMEVSTGEVRAMVGLQRRFDGELEPCRNFGYQQESRLMRCVSALAVLDAEKCTPYTRIETGSGIYFFGDRIIKDHNWHRGGYGLLSFDEVIKFSSNVGISRLVQDGYENNPQAFFNKLDSMSFGQPDSIIGIPELRPMSYTSPKDSVWTYAKLGFHSFGYERKIAPIQMLTFFNAIANDGRMMKPLLYHGDSIVINPQIAKLKHIREMQAVLYNTVKEGLGKRAGTEKVEVSGCPGGAEVALGLSEDPEYNDDEYHIEFCGYFPAQRPRYSIIVSMNKIGLPASGGGMAGPVFRQIVDYMVDRGM